MVKIERTPAAPASLAIEREKANGSYTKPDVIRQLQKDFHGKCYLCEIDELQTVQVEHLKPHHGREDQDRLFEWDNLFLSCGHCNNLKSGKYEELIDCCRDDPERFLNQELIGGHVKVAPTVKSISAQQTARLITECFEKTNTGIREMECAVRVKKLEETMTLLYKTLDEYVTLGTPKSERTLRAMLNRNYRFAGFIRTYVRKNLDRYPALAELVQLD